MISILLDQMTSTRFGIDCQDCQIRHKAICANSDADELAQLNSFKTYAQFQPDEMITYSGDPLDYVGTLVTGMAEISMAFEDGRRQILGLLMPGDFIGRPDRLYCKYDIKALDHIQFCRFDRKDFKSLLARSPSLSQRLYEMTMDELDATRDWMLLLGSKTAREKLASLLFLIAIKQQGLSLLSHHQNFEFDLLLTREITPVAVCNGDEVYAGEINLNGVIHIEVTGEKEDSLLHRIIVLVRQAETSRNRYTALADRAASVYAPVVHLTALAAFCFWLWAGAGVHFAIDTAIAVLIITCPCALGLATPAVITNASSRLFRNGVLLKSATALERLASIDTVVFDKTGTLSTGQFQAKLSAGFSAKDRACLKALAAMSHHPYAKAIVNALDQTEAHLMLLEDVEEIPSKGMQAKFDGDVVKLGRPDWVDPDLTISPDFSGIAFRIGTAKAKDAKTWLFPMGEALRPGMKTMMTALDNGGYQRALLTGDHAHTAQILAQDLGFDHIESHMTPEGKTQYLDALEAQGHQVMMVGDGLNDAAAMSGARLSLAPASAMDAARASADIVLLNGRLDILPDVLHLSKVARLRMLQNFGLAALYNIITIPLAFSGFATPLMAALAMSLSSITVTLNAFRLPKIDKGNAPDLFQPKQGKTP